MGDRKHRSVKNTLARRMVLVSSLNDSRPRTDDGSPLVGECTHRRTQSTPTLLRVRSRSTSDVDKVAQELNAAALSKQDDDDERITAVGSHEDIDKIDTVSVKQILENFKTKDRRNTNRVSLIRKKPSVVNRTSKITTFFENYAQQKPPSLASLPDENENTIAITTDATCDTDKVDNDQDEWEIIEIEVEEDKEVGKLNMSGLVKNSVFLQRDSRHLDIIDYSEPEDSEEEEEEEVQAQEEDIVSNEANKITPACTVKKAPVDAQARKVKLIVTEILTTERSYVKKLYLLDEVFQKELLKECAEQNLFPDKVIKEIFANLSSIHKFHETILLPDLEKRIADWDDNPMIGDIFKTLGHCFTMYTEFVKNFDNGVNVLNYWLKKCNKFAAVVEAIQKRPECENLALQHHLLGPIQRVPRYKLLLQDYLNKLPEDSPDREGTEDSLQTISKAADQANNSMKQNDMFKKILEIEDRIADGLNGETLVTASRVFIKEGEIRKQAARTENTMPRTLLLFNDLLLCCSHTTTGKFSVRQVMDVTGITVDTDDVALPEHGFRVRSRQRVLDLIAHSDDEKNEWVNAITKAVDELAAIRDMRKKRMLAEDAKTIKIGKVGDKAPVWVKDEDVTMCMTCAAKFGMVQRKHHCRGCGRIVCDKCSNYRTQLAYLGNEVKRICCACSQKITGKSQLDFLPSVQASVRTRDTKRKSDYSGPVYWKSPGMGWKMQWITLSEFVLFIQKKRQDVKSSFTLPVPGFEVEVCPPCEGFDAAHPYCLKIHKGNEKKLTYHICLDKEESFTRLLNHLKSAVKAEKLTNQDDV